MPRLQTFFVVVLLLWAAVIPCVTAADSGGVVQLLPRDGKLSESFLGALQIELGSAYRVEVVAPAAVPRSLPERVQLATSMVEAEGALACVWIDVDPETGSATVYVVGRRSGRALLEVVRASDARGLDLERMLAIKLAELLGELRTAPTHPLSAVGAEQGTTRSSQETAHLQPRAAEPEAPLSAALPWVFGVRLGPRFDLSVGTGWSRFGVAAALEPQLQISHFRVGLGLGVDAYPWLRVRANASEVRLREVTPRVWLSAGWFGRELAWTFHTGPGWSLMNVRGRTPSGLENAANAGAFDWAFGLSTQRALSAALALGAFVELHIAATRLHFDVNEQSVLDRGRARLTFGIDIALGTGVAAGSR